MTGCRLDFCNICLLSKFHCVSGLLLPGEGEVEDVLETVLQPRHLLGGVQAVQREELQLGRGGGQAGKTVLKLPTELLHLPVEHGVLHLATQQVHVVTQHLVQVLAPAGGISTRFECFVKDGIPAEETEPVAGKSGEVSTQGPAEEEGAAGGVEVGGGRGGDGAGPGGHSPAQRHQAPALQLCGGTKDQEDRLVPLAGLPRCWPAQRRPLSSPRPGPPSPAPPRCRPPPPPCPPRCPSPSPCPDPSQP